MTKNPIHVIIRLTEEIISEREMETVKEITVKDLREIAIEELVEATVIRDTNDLKGSTRDRQVKAAVLHLTFERMFGPDLVDEAMERVKTETLRMREEGGIQ